MRLFQRVGGARGNGDMAGKAVLADDARQRRADQPDADQRDSVKMYVLHECYPRNSVSASMTP
jgi:hypothetical protein